MRRIAPPLLAAVGLWAVRGASAQPPAPPADGAPDLDFLEYLGSWQADDEEWLAIRDWEKDHPQADAGERQRQRDGGDPPRSRDDDEESQ